MNETITLKINKSIYDNLLPYGLKNGYDLSDYIEEDETEYLTKSKADKEELDEAIDDIKNGKNLVEVELVNGFYRKKNEKNNF